MKNTIKTIAFGVIAFSMVACASQKNSTGNTYQRPSVQQSGPAQGGGQRGGQQGGQQGAQQGPSFSELLSQWDSNKDGKLAKAELKGPLVNDFSKVDTDEDGFITESEFNNAPKPQRGGQRG